MTYNVVLFTATKLDCKHSPSPSIPLPLDINGPGEAKPDMILFLLT